MTIWVICRQYEYENFTVLEAYQNHGEAENALKQLQKEDIYEEYDYWIEGVEFHND